jgi:hypothetical protein
LDNEIVFNEAVIEERDQGIKEIQDQHAKGHARPPRQDTQDADKHNTAGQGYIREA